MGKLNKLSFVLFGLIGILLVAVVAVGIIKIGAKGKDPDPKPNKPSQTEDDTKDNQTKEPKPEQSTEEKTESKTEQPSKREVLFEDFEGETHGFSGRQNETLEVVEGGADGTGHCLKVSNRTENWNGGIWRSNGALQGGDKIDVSCMVKYEYEVPEEGGEDIAYDVLEVTVEYTLNGTQTWPQMGMIKVAKGKWIELTGSLEIPEGATDIGIYVEAERTEDLYIDEFRVNVE